MVNPSRRRKPAAATPASDQPERTHAIDFVQIQPGLFLNANQIASVWALPREADGVYAVLQLASGERLNLTRAQFTAITGEEVQAGMPSQVPAD